MVVLDDRGVVATEAASYFDGSEIAIAIDAAVPTKQEAELLHQRAVEIRLSGWFVVLHPEGTAKPNKLIWYFVYPGDAAEDPGFGS